MGEKKGQVTIFVILGIAIIGLIFLAFVLLSPQRLDEIKNPILNQAPRSNSQEFMEECVKPHLEDAIDKLIAQGGYVYNKQPSLVYKFRNISYLCYTSSYDSNCMNLEPMLISAVQDEIASYVLPKANECFDKFLEVYSEYDSKVGATELEAKIFPNKIMLDLQKNIIITAGETIISFEDFPVEISSPLYTFLIMATELSNEETACNCGEENCNSDYFNIDNFNRGFVTSRFTGSMGERVYTIEYLRTGEEFNFAIRNCIENR